MGGMLRNKPHSDSTCPYNRFTGDLIAVAFVPQQAGPHTASARHQLSLGPHLIPSNTSSLDPFVEQCVDLVCSLDLAKHCRRTPGVEMERLRFRKPPFHDFKHSLARPITDNED